jgi:hypothetical protein
MVANPATRDLNRSYGKIEATSPAMAATLLSAVYTGEYMISPTHGKTSSRREATNAMQQTVAADSVGFPIDAAQQSAQDVWQIRLNSLQQWVCELLIKNQQLRMALTEIKAREQQG